MIRACNKRVKTFILRLTNCLQNITPQYGMKYKKGFLFTRHDIMEESYKEHADVLENPVTAVIVPTNKLSRAAASYISSTYTALASYILMVVQCTSPMMMGPLRIGSDLQGV